MNIEQENFKKILNKHCQENMTTFTSNDFHTIWNALVEYEADAKHISTDLLISADKLTLSITNYLCSKLKEIDPIVPSMTEIVNLSYILRQLLKKEVTPVVVDIKNNILRTIDDLIIQSINGRSAYLNDVKIMNAYNIRIDALNEIKTLIINM